jgi:hypothetical protein
LVRKKNLWGVFLPAIVIWALFPGCGSTVPQGREGSDTFLEFSEDSLQYDASIEQGRQRHIVQKGETLWSISRKYYGEGRHWKRILDANPRLEPDDMKVGEEIIIPAPFE